MVVVDLGREEAAHPLPSPRRVEDLHPKRRTRAAGKAECAGGCLREQAGRFQRDPLDVLRPRRPILDLGEVMPTRGRAERRHRTRAREARSPRDHARFPSLGAQDDSHRARLRRFTKGAVLWRVRSVGTTCPSRRWAITRVGRPSSTTSPFRSSRRPRGSAHRANCSRGFPTMHAHALIGASCSRVSIASPTRTARSRRSEPARPTTSVPGIGSSQ